MFQIRSSQTAPAPTSFSSVFSNANTSSNVTSAGGLTSGTMPQTLDQLLERQWEQGSQFLMEQAQHFDSKCEIRWSIKYTTGFFLCIVLIALIIKYYGNFFITHSEQIPS